MLPVAILAAVSSSVGLPTRVHVLQRAQTPGPSGGGVVRSGTSPSDSLRICARSWLSRPTLTTRACQMLPDLVGRLHQMHAACSH